MAARSTKITVRNRTRVPLTHLDDHLDSGIWTESLRPPPVVPPGATMWWKSESDGVATGTEGRARYAVGPGGQEVTWHWSNPFAGLNRYQQDIGPGFGISFSAGLGDHAAPFYTVAPDTPVAVPDFLPSRNALQFTNTFPSGELMRLRMPDPFADIPIGDAADGLCGGMAFLTADYYHHGSRAPRDTTAPAPDTPLLANLVLRLLHSFDIPDGVAEFLTLMSPLYGDSDNIVDNGRAWSMAHVQWPRVRNCIDEGRLCPLNLICVRSLLPTDLGQNHQVLVYAYALAGNHLTMRVYDPNSAHGSPDDVTLSLDLSRTDRRIRVHHTIGLDGGPVYAFFVPPYRPQPVTDGIPRLPVSLRQFLEVHEFDPAGGVAARMADRGSTTLRELLTTP